MEIGYICCSCVKSFRSTESEYKNGKKMLKKLKLHSFFALCKSCGKEMMETGVLHSALGTLLLRADYIDKNLITVYIGYKEDLHLCLIEK